MINAQERSHKLIEKIAQFHLFISNFSSLFPEKTKEYWFMDQT
jgi:hypothetical protein